MNKLNSSEHRVSSEIPQDQSWRPFLGSKELYIIRKSDKAILVQDPVLSNTYYNISEEEAKEIKEANTSIWDAMSEKVNTTEYPKVGNRRWDNMLGEEYLSTQQSEYVYKLQDIWDYRIWHTISQEEYMEIELVNKKYDLRKKYRLKQPARDLKAKGIHDHLDNKGYMRGRYRERLYDELTKNDLTMDTVPQYLEQYKGKQEGVSIREEADYYEKAIVKFLNRYKNNSFERTYLSNYDLIQIEDLIDKATFSGPKLLEYSTSLEKIVHKNFVQTHKRMYQYGYAYGHKGFRNEPPKTEYIDCLDQINTFLTEGGNVEDLGDTREDFHQKIRKSLKHQFLENKYTGWDNSYFMKYHPDFGINKEELPVIKEEAYGEWDNFLMEKFKSTINLQDDLDIFLNKSYNNFRNYQSSINKVDYNESRTQDFCNDIRRSIHNSKEFGSQSEYDEAYRDQIASLLENYILEGIKKIKTRERVDKAPFTFESPDGYEERSETFGVHKSKDKDTIFLHILYHLVEQKINMLRALDSELVQYNPEQVTRYNERESYKHLDIQDYLDAYDHKKEFIIQRVNTVLAENLSFHQDGILDRDIIIEEISPQLIQTSKTKLYELLQNDVKNNIFGFYPVFLADAMKYAKFSLFIPGYATVLKQLYPDQEERTSIRQKYIQTIIKELVLELQDRLLLQETFSLQEYCMRQPLLYVYNRYGGQEEIGIDGQVILNNYYQHMITKYQSFLEPFMLEIQQDTMSPTDLYHKMNDYTSEFKRMTFFFVNTKKKGIQTKLTQGMIKKQYTTFESDFNNSNIALQLPIDIQKIYYILQQNLEDIKQTILYKIASQRIDQNFNGRIKRILENVLSQKFGAITFSDDQMAFVYEYLGSIIEPAIARDLEYIVNCYDIEILNKTIIRPAMSKFLESKHNKEKKLPTFTLANIQD